MLIVIPWRDSAISNSNWWTKVTNGQFSPSIFSNEKYQGENQIVPYVISLKEMGMCKNFWVNLVSNPRSEKSNCLVSTSLLQILRVHMQALYSFEGLTPRGAHSLSHHILTPCREGLWSLGYYPCGESHHIRLTLAKAEKIREKGLISAGSKISKSFSVHEKKCQ